MDLTQTAVIRIEAKQVDRLYNVAHLDCIAAVVGSVLLLTAGWIFGVPKAALALSAIPTLISIGRWAVALSYNRASRRVRRSGGGD